MKGILKKNQIMITALAVMIAIAGYLNFAGNKLESEQLVTTNSDNVKNDTLGIVDDGVVNDAEGLNDVSALDISEEDNEQANLSDIESLDTDIDMAATDYLDESMDIAAAQPTADGEIPGEAVFTSAGNVNTLSGAKLLKEQTRAKNKETLLELINSQNIDNTQKQTAIDNMIALTDIAEKETAAEILLETKGFANSIVSISQDTVDVIINAAELSDASRAQIEDIVKRKTGAPAENIVITPMAGN